MATILLLMGLRVALLDRKPGVVHLPAYQRLDTSLRGAQFNLYQSLRAAVAEITSRWSREQAWPDAERLRREAIPPFAPEFLPRSLQGYRWQAFDQKGWIDYLGQAPGEQPAFLLRVVDLGDTVHPHPHPSYDPALKVAAQVWMYSGRPVPYPIQSMLEADWIWIVNLEDPSLQGRR